MTFLIYFSVLEYPIAPESVALTVKMYSIARIFGAHISGRIVKDRNEIQVKYLLVVGKSRKAAVELVDPCIREGIRICIGLLLSNVHIRLDNDLGVGLILLNILDDLRIVRYYRGI